MSHEITTPSGNRLFGLWAADADWQDDSFPDLEPLIVGIQREAAATERKATVERIRAAFSHARIDRDADVFAILDAEAGR